jgi:hypothetical protein
MIPLLLLVVVVLMMVIRMIITLRLVRNHKVIPFP